MGDANSNKRRVFLEIISLQFKNGTLLVCKQHFLNEWL